MRYLDKLKKFFVLLVAAISISIVSVNNASAVSNWEYYLQVIAQNSYAILDRVNNVPVFLQNIATALLSLQQQDNDSNSLTYRVQNYFAQLGLGYTQQNAAQAQIQRQVMADVLGVPLSDFNGRNPKILQQLPNVNELAYGTLLNQPPTGIGARNVYNYVKNAAGMSVHHVMPDPRWEGDKDAKEKYQNYYFTVTSIESYNAYLVSRLLTEAARNPSATQLQDALVNQASSSSWIAEIATEEIGKVLRQILLFQSQNYVLNTQIERHLRELVISQAMGNTLATLFNDQFEQQMVDNAQSRSQ